ncbi:Fatty acid hydroxylase superfamily [Serratia entomophila]|jgi:sterol desaturase/sphingolipid hydroxylase (fatty acid hydroxylase superfamily)|uniref:sterol desaturase family protein n=1 Tax=Serratia entomophila TaxID=42906 RepID=UPI002177E2B2|nr:sterol desaturase family protein [Serratia entomophila]CAI0743977.1 Fatty acid hydroxylase superfamily [Serratia entomophila]CAI1501234.1 Fatty acid hydroxylase superfamily [Serratia entomophila]CAI1507393.1 Fatty acid hydroxylase superfamily [Serratia entomophila]CAI1530825.1 Fatty acid hydroxylase superfamily [Serratia entomophila]CAI1595483.1 Fatty acid hydroxylase superfamily [Serratia entomophila]
MSSLAMPIVFMLFVVVGEALVLQWVQRRQVNWHDLVFNLNSGHIMLWLFRGLEITCYGYVAAHFSLGLLDAWPPLLMWLFALLAWDFGFYWLHRLHHHLRVLWAVHLVHHQGEHFNLSLGVRNSWYSSLTSIPFFLLLALLGVPLSVFVTVSILHYSIQLFNHNALTPRLGVLEKILVTPAHHRVHHVKDLAYSNKNFGGSFIFWDKLFGTFCPSLPDKPFVYGVSGDKSSANPFLASNQPFLRYLRPTWRPNVKPGRYRRSALSVFSGAMLLFTLVIGYVYQYGYGYSDVGWPQMALLTLLALGSMALGGMSEGRGWASAAWLLVTLAMPLLFVGYLAWPQRYWQIAMAILALHGVCVALGWGRAKAPVAAEAPHG